MEGNDAGTIETVLEVENKKYWRDEHLQVYYEIVKDDNSRLSLRLNIRIYGVFFYLLNANTDLTDDYEIRALKKWVDSTGDSTNGL